MSTENEYTPWVNLGITEVQYWEKRYLEQRAEVEKLKVEMQECQGSLEDAICDSDVNATNLCKITAIILRGEDTGPITSDDIKRAREVAASLYRVKRESVSKKDLNVAVRSLCSCGGHGPNDPGVCDICKLWHMLTRTKPLSERGEG